MANVPVRVRDCACPGSPHDEGDFVYLREKTSLEGGMAAHRDIITANGDDNELVLLWRPTFVRHNAIGWNFVDAKGQPVPFSVEAVLDDFELAYPVSEAALELYRKVVLDPLLDRPSTTSQPGPTVVSMSRAKRSTRKPQRRSSQPSTDGRPSQARSA